jgi:UDP-glucose 4-epimerase
MSSVLVTGASSTIGERLIRSLLADRRIDHVLAVGFEPFERALPFDRSSRLTYLQVDMGRARHIRRLLFGPARDLGVETIFHTALVEDAADAGRRVHRINVESTRQILALCERHPTIRKLVYRSFAEVYQIQADLPALIEEDHPLNLAGGAPQWIRDRVEADLTVCAAMGLSRLRIVVLRCAEVLAQGCGSQLFDYLESPICLRPGGYNPMINVLSVADLVRAMELAHNAHVQGVFNVPGKDTLPLSTAILKWGRMGVPLPSHWLTPIYAWRRRTRGHDFRFGMNRRRFTYSGILDGTRARTVLGYTPETAIDWPLPVSEAWGPGWRG